MNPSELLTGNSRKVATGSSRTGFYPWLAFALMLLAGQASALADVHRTLDIRAPGSASAGSSITVTLSASTDSADEKVGFFQAEYSIDNGKTWTGLCYDTDTGPSARRDFTLLVGASASTALIRVRAGFRGKAGDVDFNGNALDWDGSWNKWLKPPAKYSRTVVTAR